MAKSILSKFAARTSAANAGAKKRGAYGKIPPKDILLRMELQNWSCMYCKTKISLFTCEVEHIIAIHKGGEHYLYNIVLSCHECNTVKGVRSLKRFCKVMGLDLDTLRQEIAELNAKQHSLTDFDDEYGSSDLDE